MPWLKKPDMLQKLDQMCLETFGVEYPLRPVNVGDQIRIAMNMPDECQLLEDLESEISHRRYLAECLLRVLMLHLQGPDGKYFILYKPEPIMSEVSNETIQERLTERIYSRLTEKAKAKHQKSATKVIKFFTEDTRWQTMNREFLPTAYESVVAHDFKQLFKWFKLETAESTARLSKKLNNVVGKEQKSYQFLYLDEAVSSVQMNPSKYICEEMLKASQKEFIVDVDDELQLAQIE